jgi:hypothetical protein
MAIPQVCIQELPAQDQPPDLVTPIKHQKDPLLATIQTNRSVAVTVDIKLLAESKPNDVIRVRLFEDKVFLARLEKRQDIAKDHYVWTGTLENLPLSSFIIAVCNDRVDASFFPRDGHPFPLMIQGAPGMHVVRELDHKFLKDKVQVAPLEPLIPGPEAACNDDPDKVTILVVYDKVALAQAKSTAAMLAAVTARVTYLNGIMQNSNLNLRFNLATGARAVNYTTGTLNQDLSRLSGTGDGYMDDVHSWRNTYKADLIHLLVGADRTKHGGYIGLGYTPSSMPTAGAGFSVSEWNATYVAMSHELGHNFGCQHDPANISSPGSLIYPYARGHKFGVPLLGFTTIMGYNEIWYPTYAQVLSSPTVKWGIWTTGGSLNDNRRCMLNTRQAVANFKRTNVAPVFTVHPKNASKCQGYQSNTTIMSVAVTHAPRYTTSYQWYRNSVAVSGQTKAILTLPNITPANAGTWYCRASNSCGSTNSNTATLTVSSTCNTRRFATTSTGTLFGYSVSRAGDFNRDGYEDFVYGEPRSLSKGTFSGLVQVRSGKDSAVLLSLSYAAGEWLGHSVADAGDVDQDGYADIVVGAPYWSSSRGYARVISGKTKAQKYIFYGDSAGQYFGYCVSGAGDVNGDGHPDVIVGGPSQSKVRVYSGKDGSVLWNLAGKSGERYGQAVGQAGDIDQDGYDDVIVGATHYSSQNGYVEVVSGRTGGTIWKLFGVTKGSFGHAVDGVGDVNADGFPDFAVGIPGADTKGNNSGRVDVYSGKDKSALHQISYGANEFLGMSVAAAGDVDGDGRPDFHVGAPGYNNSRGYVRTLSGKTGGQIGIRFGLVSGSFGISVDGFEANGDAIPDLLVGETYGGTGGAVWLFDAPLASDPPEIEIFGAACRSSIGTLPHVAFVGRLALGKTFDPSVYAGVPNVTTWFMIDAKRSDLSLDPMGAAGCTGYALPLLILPTTTQADGRASFSIPVPTTTSLVGTQVYTQWLLVDTSANAAGFITSNAARLKMGRQ